MTLNQLKEIAVWSLANWPFVQEQDTTHMYTDRSKDKIEEPLRENGRVLICSSTFPACALQGYWYNTN